jgi:hypothetical protein
MFEKAPNTDYTHIRLNLPHGQDQFNDFVRPYLIYPYTKPIFAT